MTNKNSTAFIFKTYRQSITVIDLTEANFNHGKNLTFCFQWDYNLKSREFFLLYLDIYLLDLTKMMKIFLMSIPIHSSSTKTSAHPTTLDKFKYGYCWCCDDPSFITNHIILCSMLYKSYSFFFYKICNIFNQVFFS